MIDQYRIRGHEHADIDPLEMDKSLSQHGKKLSEEPPKFSHRDYGFSDADLQKELYINEKVSKGLTNADPNIKLETLLKKLKTIYQGKIGYQYMHITDTERRYWIRDKIESIEQFTPTEKDMHNTGRRLCRDHSFNSFCKEYFPAQKRFGSEGTDSVISGLEALIDEAAKAKVENVVFGMAHRGRLSTLFNVIKKPAA